MIAQDVVQDIIEHLTKCDAQQPMLVHAFVCGELVTLEVHGVHVETHSPQRIVLSATQVEEP